LGFSPTKPEARVSPISVTSCGKALAAVVHGERRGRAVCQRRELCTFARLALSLPLFGFDEGSVAKGLGEIKPSSLTQVLGEVREYSLQRAVTHPLLEAVVAGLVRGIAAG